MRDAPLTSPTSGWTFPSARFNGVRQAIWSRSGRIWSLELSSLTYRVHGHAPEISWTVLKDVSFLVRSILLRWWP